MREVGENAKGCAAAAMDVGAGPALLSSVKTEVATSGNARKLHDAALKAAAAFVSHKFSTELERPVLHAVEVQLEVHTTC